MKSDTETAQPCGVDRCTGCPSALLRGGQQEALACLAERYGQSPRVPESPFVDVDERVSTRTWNGAIKGRAGREG